MSGAEVVGLISAIISIIDASIKVYSAVSDASGLPTSFRDAASRLPLVKDTLEAAIDGIEDASQDAYQSMLGCLEHCQAKAEDLKIIFFAVMPPEDASSMQRIVVGIKAVSKQEQVRRLVKEIGDDLQVLTANYAIKAATRAQMDELIMLVKRGLGRASDASIQMYNTGPGTQVNRSGQGDQNISSSQINGVFHGPFNFTTTG